ncbi:MAG: lysophospholipid acyltransferase family protein [Syntrophobacteria bacterium]
MFRSLLFYTTLLFLTVTLALMVIPIALLARSGRIPHLFARFWARSLLMVSGVRVEVEGLEKIDLHQAYVFAANHQSQFDIFALFACLPLQFRWLAKKELFRIPLFGAAMKKADYIPIDRSNRKEAFRSVDLAAARVREGMSIVIFPEGTRSQDGRLNFFKKGGFFLAMKSGRPIVPVTISGSYGILPKKGYRIRPGVVRVYIGDPLPTEGLEMADKDWLISEVRRRIQLKLPPEEKGEPEPQPALPTRAAPEGP